MPNIDANFAPRFVAVDPATGCHVRDATAEEIAEYNAQPCIHPSFRKALRVGDVMIDDYRGPGVHYGHLPLFWD